MPQKLGEILIAGSVLSPADLKKALDAQLIFGGRLGTNLLDLGYLDEETLSLALRHQKRVEVATPRMLEQATPEAIRMVPARLADRHKVVPLALEDRKLKVAMLDPTDLIALDELAFVTGCTIVPFLSPEVRLLSYLERHYDVPRPLRYIRLSRGEEPERDGLSDAAIAARSTPGVQSFQESTATTPAGTAWAERPTEAEGLAPESERVLSLEDILDAPSEGSVAPGHSQADAAEAEEMESRREAERRAAPVVPLTLEETCRRLSEAETRDDIGEALVGMASAQLTRVVAWIVQKDVALGWQAVLPGLSAEQSRMAARQVVVPLDAPSVLVDVVQTGRYYMGEPPQRPGDRALVEALGPPPPAQLVIVPVTLNEKVVIAVQGDNGSAPLGAIDLRSIRTAALKAGQAMEVLLLRSRIRQVP